MLIMASDPDQSNELSVLAGMIEVYLPILLKILGRIDCTIRVFQSFGACAFLCIKSRAAKNLFYIDIIEILRRTLQSYICNGC